MNNPHYENGLVQARNMIKHIEKSTYGTLEKAIESKKELVDDLKKNFDWDETNKDVAEALGMITAFEEEVLNQEKDKPEEILQDIEVIDVASSAGIRLSSEQLSKVKERYPEEKEKYPDTEWYLIVEQLLNDINNEE